MNASKKVEANRNRLSLRYAKTRYFESAEQPSWLEPFWSPDSNFLALFKQLNLESVCDFACGHGRHSEQIKDQFTMALLVDVNETAIAQCRLRFADLPNVRYHICNGKDLEGVPDASLTSLFSYDAMVHFEAMDMIGYLFEFQRVLAPSGRALLHYSVNTADPTGDMRSHPGSRNFFSEEMMLHFADRAGFKALARQTFEWPPGSGNPVSDGLVLLERIDAPPSAL